MILTDVTTRRIERGSVHMAAADEHQWLLVVSGAMYNSTGYVYVAPTITYERDDGCVLLPICSFSYALIDQLRKVPVHELGACVFRLTPQHRRSMDRMINSIFLADEEQQR